MKLLTLNTHSLEERDMERKQREFVTAVSRLQPDVIALQEVNQSQDAPLAGSLPESFRPVLDEFGLRKDNHALALSRLFEQENLNYEWTWLPIKTGYDRYDEGMAFFSKKPILEMENILVSSCSDFDDPHIRRILGVRTEEGRFYSIHLSWWNDPVEPFKEQWIRLKKELAEKDGFKVLMGDFNADAHARHEGYDLVKSSGFFDTFDLAENRDSGVTVPGVIDGWRDQKEVSNMRIDQIWTSAPMRVKTSRVLFNGKNEPVISDHYGVLAELDEMEDPARENRSDS